MIGAPLSDERYFDASHFALDENAAARIQGRRRFEPGKAPPRRFVFDLACR
jgi:hypothetical protein